MLPDVSETKIGQKIRVLYYECAWCHGVFSVIRSAAGRPAKYCQGCKPLIARLATAKSARKRVTKYRAWRDPIVALIGPRQHWIMYPCAGWKCDKTIIAGRRPRSSPEWIPAFTGLTLIDDLVIVDRRVRRMPRYCPDCAERHRKAMSSMRSGEWYWRRFVEPDEDRRKRRAALRGRYHLSRR